MEFPGKINTDDYKYILPDEKIAKYPLETRDGSKLLVYRNKEINSYLFSDLPDILTPEHKLIFNNTRVIQARLLFYKSTGAIIELFLLEPYEPAEYQNSFASKKECTWKCLVGNAKKWKEEKLEKQILIGNFCINLYAEKIAFENVTFLIKFRWDNHLVNFSAIISSTGLTPIPPYLDREAEETDKLRYQTVYSKNEGSVAAPTAGLHFTAGIMDSLIEKGISRTDLTLHVGAGTFLPVKEQDASKHGMHSEQIFISRNSLEQLYKSEHKFIAVGTTSVRTLESIYWLGVKIDTVKSINGSLYLDQWEPFRLKEGYNRKKSLENVLNYMQQHKMENLSASTRIMIAPGYNFRMIDGMITNFHQPYSTLLMLIAAFTGEDWKKIYDYALYNGFRFLSYGDSSLLLR